MVVVIMVKSQTGKLQRWIPWRGLGGWGGWETSTQATQQQSDYRREEGDGHENGRKLFNNIDDHSSLAKTFQLHQAILFTLLHMVAW